MGNCHRDREQVCLTVLCAMILQLEVYFEPPSASVNKLLCT